MKDILSKHKQDVIKIVLIVFVCVFMFESYAQKRTNKLDFDQSTIKCNFAPDYKTFTFAQAQWHFTDADLRNYDYKSFYTDPAHDEAIKKLIKLCNGVNRDIGDLTVQQGFFDIDPSLLHASSAPSIERIRSSATWEHHVFDLVLVNKND